ncbi:MAG: hypothetical protein RLN61_06965, partial [Algiphilus sp.]
SFVFNLDVQVELTIAMLAQLSRSRVSPFEFSPLVIPGLQLNSLSAVNGSKAYRPVLFAKPKQVFVTVDAAWGKSFNRFAF